jgi:hypothetical protein
MRRCVAFAVMASVACGAAAQTSKPADVWYSAGHIGLTATGAGLNAEWQFDRANNGDVRLVKNERRDSARISGTILSVCDDRALVFKDITPAPRHEMQELNEPVLHLQLTLRLLARAMPDGLPAAGSDIAIDTGDDKTTLRLRKNFSARKDIGAPWRARGSARRTGSEVRFEIAVTYAGDNPPHPRQDLKLAGVWSQQSRAAGLDNALNLSGWRVHRVDLVSENVGGNIVMDTVANTTPLTFATLGDVRARIGRSWNPNVKAPQHTTCKL